MSFSTCLFKVSNFLVVCRNQQFFFIQRLLIQDNSIGGRWLWKIQFIIQIHSNNVDQYLFICNHKLVVFYAFLVITCLQTGVFSYAITSTVGCDVVNNFMISFLLKMHEYIPNHPLLDKYFCTISEFQNNWSWWKSGETEPGTVVLDMFMMKTGSHSNRYLFFLL